VEYIKKCFAKKEPLERGMHNKAMLLFNQYMLVGGMPKPVVAFIQNKKDFTESDKEKRDILRLYREDIMKIDARYRSKVLSIFDQIPGFLSQHEKRIVFKQLQDGSYADQYEETFFWLADSMISNESFLCNDPNVGLSLNETRSYVKCYLGDTGLLVSHAFDENELLEDDVYKQILAGKLQINEGMLYENVIAQMLKASGKNLFYHTIPYAEGKKYYEIDFLVTDKHKISPVEVKSSGYKTHKSLDVFCEKFSERVKSKYVIYTKDYKRENGVEYVPVYMTMFL
jgi:predicted AAA+ superfamily ATPase